MAPGPRSVPVWADSHFSKIVNSYVNTGEAIISRVGAHLSPLVTTSDAASQKMTIPNAFVLQSITELTMSCLLVTMVVTVVRYAVCYDLIISNKARITACMDKLSHWQCVSPRKGHTLRLTLLDALVQSIHISGFKYDGSFPVFAPNALVMFL